MIHNFQRQEMDAERFEMTVFVVKALVDAGDLVSVGRYLQSLHLSAREAIAVCEAVNARLPTVVVDLEGLDADVALTCDAGDVGLLIGGQS